MGKSSTKHDKPRLSVQCRLWAAKLMYDVSFAILVRSTSWQEDLFVSLAPKPGDRILDLGPGSSSSAIPLAVRYPEATFVIVDPNAKAAERMRLRAARKRLRNIVVMHASLPGRLPLNAETFDTVICMLALHDNPPDEKLGMIKEVARVLRHGGTMRAVDFDKPENPDEGRILELGSRIAGAAAMVPHFNGSWVDLLAKGGLSGARRQSSCSVGIGRLSIVRARKR